MKGSSQILHLEGKCKQLRGLLEDLYFQAKAKAENWTGQWLSCWNCSKPFANIDKAYKDSDLCPQCAAKDYLRKNA